MTAATEGGPGQRTAVPRGAGYTLAVLTGMNLLNYVDRYVPSAVKELFKPELGLSDAQTSLPLTAFVLVYMVTSPVFGSLADRWSRKWIIGGGVALWSLATAAAALANSFWPLLLSRALVGVGEAAYATLSPALISDFYPPARRNRALTFFYVAIPVGSAIGFAVAGKVGEAFGWRAAFLVCGLPGLLAALFALYIPDPGRGTFDKDAHQAPPAWPEALRLLRANREYVLAVAGYVAVTFASGALADWFPAYLTRHRAIGVGDAGLLVGVSAVVGGLGGTVLGGIVGDALKGKTRHPYLALSAVSMGVASVLAVLALMVEGYWPILICMVVAQLFLWGYNAPINTVLVNCVPSRLRVRAFALSILLIHLFGDAVSPSIVGVIADSTGHLSYGIALVPVSMLIGTLIWLFAWRRLDVVPQAV